ncbi:hypothetical protein IMZ11_35795 [Microtetraspora sp. AC03309]|uniref:hypothetical protein n=1 Tax=Microtetraspora sp. AC03309 TaxID=2779376 RepID=UPI001E485E65|nr:hypothetical protein [Microtetraspora sp. AC03309]MCC5580989.1 hypothetical protein [Microtetraspora sp. AC03309]
MTAPLQTPAADLGGRRALLLALAALICTFMLPAAGLALSIFGLAVAFRDVRTLSRARRPVGAAAAGLVIAVVSFLFGGLLMATQLFFSAELNAYVECGKGAGTVTAAHDCLNELKSAVERRLGVAWPANLPFPN